MQQVEEARSYPIAKESGVCQLEAGVIWRSAVGGSLEGSWKPDQLLSVLKNGRATQAPGVSPRGRALGLYLVGQDRQRTKFMFLTDLLNLHADKSFAPPAFMPTALPEGRSQTCETITHPSYGFNNFTA